MRGMPLRDNGGWVRVAVRQGLRAGAAATLLLALAIAALLVTGSITSGNAFAEPSFPKLTGRVVDNANLLDAATKAQITADLAQLEEKSTDQLVVVTLPSLGGYAIEDYGYQLGRHWAIGQKGKDNGAILIVAPNERKVRIEVGRGLEPHLTDAMSRLIIENAILPRFRRGDFQGGIVAGVRDMKDVVTGDAEAVKERAKGARRGGEPDYMGMIILMIWLAIFIFIIYSQHRNASQMPQSAGHRRRSGFNDRIIVIPGGSSDWSSGGWSGGSGGGGGFGGGGGSFGGGGASGDW